jgi:hypothetical protein
MKTFNTATLSNWAAVQAFPSQYEIFRAKERRRGRMRAAIAAEARKSGKWPRNALAAVSSMGLRLA